MLDASLSIPNIKTWQSCDYPARDALEIFTEALRSFGEFSSVCNCEFDSRLDVALLARGALVKSRVCPISSKHSPQEGQDDWVTALFVVSGDITIKQRGEQLTVSPGELLLLDSSAPFVSSSRNGRSNITLRVSKSSLPHIGEYPSTYVIPRNEVMTPLVSCFYYISTKELRDISGELDGLYDASVSLLSASLQPRSGDAQRRSSHYLLQAAQSVIAANLSDVALSPARVAQEMRISTRYLHKLFLLTGTTFGEHLRAKRLDQIMKELSEPYMQRRTIAAIALKWGFGDLSTFHRAFVKRFGRSPKSFR